MGKETLVPVILFRHRRSSSTCPYETGGIVAGNGERRKDADLSFALDRCVRGGEGREMPLRAERVSRAVVLDLRAQEGVDGFAGLGVLRGEVDAGAALGLFVAEADLALETGHLRHAGEDPVVDGERHGEVAGRELFLRMVTRQGMTAVTIGVIAGLAGAFAATVPSPASSWE
jgi:hypothetical protein